MYKLEFLPRAVADMTEIVRYISHDLSNPEAALSLAEEFVHTAEQATKFPYANPPYQPIRPLEREYRRALIRNYLMFYWVDEKAATVTVARVIYARRDYEKLLN